MDKKGKNKSTSSVFELNNLKLSLLQSMFSCSTQEGVDIAYSFAKFLASEKLNNQNYYIFLHLFETGNHWIVDTLINEEDPETLFNVINPSAFIVSHCFTIISKFKINEIYPKLLFIILSIIKNAYTDAANGYKLYRLGCDDINNITKNFKKENNSNYEVSNKIILEILKSLSSINDMAENKNEKTKKLADYAKHTYEILHSKTKKIEEILPPQLLARGDYSRNEIAPSSLNAE